MGILIDQFESAVDRINAQSEKAQSRFDRGNSDAPLRSQSPPPTAPPRFQDLSQPQVQGGRDFSRGNSDAPRAPLNFATLAPRPRITARQMFDQYASRIAPVATRATHLADTTLPGIASGRIGVRAPGEVHVTDYGYEQGGDPQKNRQAEEQAIAAAHTSGDPNAHVVYPGENDSASAEVAKRLGQVNQIVAKPFELAAEGIRATHPLQGSSLGIAVGGANERSLGESVDQAPAAVRVPANFALDAAPYVAADVATGGALTVPFLFQASLQAAQIGAQYEAGQIDGKEALAQLAVTVGPMAIVPALHLAGRGVGALRAYVDSPEGLRLVTKLQSEHGGGHLPGEPEGIGDHFDATLGAVGPTGLTTHMHPDLTGADRSLTHAHDLSGPLEGHTHENGYPDFGAAVTEQAQRAEGQPVEPVTPDVPPQTGGAPEPLPVDAGASTTDLSGPVVPPPHQPILEPAPPVSSSPAGSGSGGVPPAPPTKNGHAIEYTGSQHKNSGTTWYEVKYLDGPKVGETARTTTPPPAGVEASKPLVNTSPEAMAHLENLVQHGDWTTTEGARTGAMATLRALQRNELPTEKQMGLLFRALESKPIEAPKIPTPRTGTPVSAGAVLPTGEHMEFAQPARGVGKVAPVPTSRGALQLALADNITDAYIGAISSKAPALEAASRMRQLLQRATTPLGAFKTIKASLDVGWGGRNGARLLPSNPGEWVSMYGKQYKALLSEESANAMDEATRAFPSFERSQDPKYARPLAYLQKETGSPELGGEEFIASDVLNKIPGIGRAFKGSERAYVDPGNWMRQAVLDADVRRAVKVVQRPLNDSEFQFLMDNINNATLRGNVSWLGKGNASTLGSLFFSLRGAVSGPQFALDFLRALPPSAEISPVVRQIVAQRVAAYFGTGMSTLGLMAAGGWGLNKAGLPAYVKVDLNKDSKTFGQINVGGFRWNYWGSDQALARQVLAQAHLGGAREIPAEGLPSQLASRRRLAVNFVGGKLAPGVPSWLFTELARSGYDPYTGQNINTLKGFGIYAGMQAVPLPASNAAEAYQNIGPAGVPASLAADTLVGTSTSTYSNAPTADQLSTAGKQKVTEKLNQAGIPNADTAIVEDKAWRDYIAGNAYLKAAGVSLDGITNRSDLRNRYVEATAAQIAQRDGISLERAKDVASNFYDTLPEIKAFNAAEKKARLEFWRAHPDLLLEAADSGLESLNEEERKILSAQRAN